ncbi:hypothetical protein ACIQOW_16680 [Kitasatospora sp. NPDC091335]|uniref:hypothetical protein n=1 Tax=Kitasatospora sp. NPDC091335 TaxID=3364085 RepID=UPI00381C9989
MRTRPRTRSAVRAVAAALLIAAATAQATTQAQAQPREEVPQPGLIATTDLPPDSLTWQVSSIGPGWKDDAPCLWNWAGPAVSEDRLFTANFMTSETAAATENVIVLPTEAEAVATLDSVRQYLAGCADRTRASSPTSVVTGYDHGTVDVEEGATVGGVHLQKVPAWEGYRNFLYGVGRDGNTVAIVEWESNWTQPDVPAFKETVRAAVNKLY